MGLDRECFNSYERHISLDDMNQSKFMGVLSITPI